MDDHAARLRRYIADHGIEAEHRVFQQSCHSVAEAALAVNASPTDLVKNICLIDARDRLIVAIVNGEDRVSTSRVGKTLGGDRLRSATPEEILARTGYPCGGTPSFGFSALFLVDPRVLEMAWVYTGGGSPHALVRISSRELVRVNRAEVVRIRG